MFKGVPAHRQCLRCLQVQLYVYIDLFSRVETKRQEKKSPEKVTETSSNTAFFQRTLRSGRRSRRNIKSIVDQSV